jgi:uncharacterized protein (DUF58 family)
MNCDPKGNGQSAQPARPPARVVSRHVAIRVRFEDQFVYGNEVQAAGEQATELARREVEAQLREGVRCRDADRKRVIDERTVEVVFAL